MSNVSNKKLLEVNITNTLKSISLFLHSANKLKSPPADLNQISPDDLEPYDAFFNRFERAVELVFNKLSKSIDIFETGQQSDTARDRLNLMHKIGLISSVEIWIEMRNMRNKISHEYIPEKIQLIYSKLKNQYQAELENFQESITLYTKMKIDP